MIVASNLDEMIPIVCNTDDRAIYGNVAAASKRDLPWLGLTPPHDGVAVIVGGGPSMKPLLPMIAAHQRSGHRIFALNGVTPTLKLADVVPDYFVLLDARESNLEFLHPDPRTHNLIASQCPPSVFDKLRGYDVTLWHPNYPDIEEHIGPGRYALIGGGSTVGLQAMSIAFALGYRTLHLYGMDSSYAADGSGHAYAQAVNDEDGREVLYVAGEQFIAAPWMARQAMEFQTLAGKLAEDDTAIHVHGTGLLPAIAKAMSAEPLSEPQKYQAMWDKPQYRDVAPGENFAVEFINRCQPHAGHVVLDFGCGTGRGGQRIHDIVGCWVRLVDFAENCLDPGIDLPFNLRDLTLPMGLVGDLGYCTDVMEHIPPQDVQAVIDNIMACVPECFFKIAMFHDQMGALIGHPLHLSVFPVEWWRERFDGYRIAYEASEPEAYATFHIQRLHERA